MYVCIYIYIYIHTYTHTYVYILLAPARELEERPVRLDGGEVRPRHLDNNMIILCILYIYIYTLCILVMLYC